MLFLLVTLIISSIQIHPYALKNYTLKNKEEILAKICKEPYFPYQDIIINNTLSSQYVLNWVLVFRYY